MLWIGAYPASPSFCRHDSSAKAGAGAEIIAAVGMTNAENASVFLNSMCVLLMQPIRFPPEVWASGESVNERRNKRMLSK